MIRFLQDTCVICIVISSITPTHLALSLTLSGYQGSQAAMYSIRDADLVIALGTRLSPFGTLPQYGEEYFPKDAKIIQVES